MSAPMTRAESTRRQTLTFQRPISRPMSSRQLPGDGAREFPTSTQARDCEHPYSLIHSLKMRAVR